MPLIAALSCERQEVTDRPRDDSMRFRGGIVKRRTAAARVHVIEAIDWNESAGVFIGIETFRGAVDAFPPVDFAADDATDMAYLFTHELKHKIPASRVSLLLAGTPHKATSLAALNELRRRAHVLIDGQHTPLGSGAIYEHVRHAAHKVGAHGVLVIFIATHGLTVNDEHRLLMPDATYSAKNGITLASLLGQIPSRSRTRVLLFVDACRTEASDAMDGAATTARRLESLRFPAAYAIFAAATAGREAASDKSLQNGYFTHAVLEGLRCNARTPLITPVILSAYVSDRVGMRTGQQQRPEGRFSDLDDEPLAVCRDIEVASILRPRDGTRVDSTDHIVIRALEPGLYATVIVCPDIGDCSNANDRHRPVLLQQGADQLIDVQYGGIPPLHYQVYVALTADSEFLEGAATFHAVP
ncbi:MAG TPA: caspase family protein, partial [Thermoanaerobaculia bacterium]|nr:caspase family protein [Thermoanaerobaculia bacterium]